MSLDSLTDEQLAKRISSDNTELLRRFAEQKKDQEARHKALMASTALSRQREAQKAREETGQC
jgi:hypothetical protein